MGEETSIGAVFYFSSGDKSIDILSASGNIEPESQYYIASINKLFISSILLRLYADKQIELNDKISTYLPEKVVRGGVIGATYWNWLYIDLMWLKEEFRGQGYGHQLLTLAEAEARNRGAKHAYLDTFSFQAPAFYQQHGYKVFGELQDFPPGHQRYFLTKAL